MPPISLADLIPRQISRQVARRLPVDADALWKVVGDLGSSVPGGGMVERVEVEGRGAGAIRTFHFPGGGKVVERIEDYDAEARRYVYRIIDFGPLSMARYLGLAEVVLAGEGGSILSWSAMADPVGTDAGALAANIEANLTSAVEAVARHFEETPSR